MSNQTQTQLMLPAHNPAEQWIDSTGDVCIGDVVKFKEAIFSEWSGWGKSKYLGDREIIAKILKDSYGAKSQQHTFTLKIIESGEVVRRKGRNVYRNGTLRLLGSEQEEANREVVLAEKHLRGSIAREKSEARKSAKSLRYSKKDNDYDYEEIDYSDYDD